MQTFLPHRSFAKTARSLDRQRLGKQRVETLQVLRVLAGDTKGWASHPAVEMWRGHERCLIRYGLAICREWVGRGYRDSCHDKIAAFWLRFAESSEPAPTWLGRRDFHRSHQSNLKRKHPEHYTYDVPDDLEYVWPTREGGDA
jgi:hypothetical protein